MARRKKTKAGVILGDVHEVDPNDLLEEMKECMVEYAKYVLEDRAIPDYRDGLKPVHRRLLYALHTMGRREFRKSVTIVAEALGKYHPHGDKACYDAMVSSVHSKNPLVDPMGNFGTLLDEPAAMRYTEGKMSKYSDKVFFDPLYAAKGVMEMSPTFDGKHEEPVVLPASVPNLLLNGAFGIGVGARCDIPAFEPEGVEYLAAKALRGKKVSVEDCVEHLVPCCPEGAFVDLEDDFNREGLRSFYAAGRGRVRWSPDAVADLDERNLLVRGFAPSTTASLDSCLTKAKNDVNVDAVIDETNLERMAHRIHLKNSRSLGHHTEVQAALEKVHGYFVRTQTLMFTVTERFPPDEDNPQGDTEFDYINMPTFFEIWAEWRIGLERSAIIRQKRAIDAQMKRDNLLLKVVAMKEVVHKSNFEKKPVEFLVKGLDISRDDAEAVQKFEIRRLNAIEEGPLRKRIEENKAALKRLRREYDAPVKRTVKAMSSAVPSIP